MSYTYKILIASALLAACGGRAAPVAHPATNPNVTKVERPAVPSNPDTRWASPEADYVAVYDGLIKVESIAKLPEPSFPGSDFQIGVFEDAASWDRFASTAKLQPFGEIDWSRQAVIYTVLDQRTNMLSLNEFSTDGETAKLEILWVQIEPFWVDSSPAVFTLVERDKLQKVRISTDLAPLGTVALSSRG